MSLLDSGPAYESCVVYPEVFVEDRWGNPQPKASTTGIQAKARFQPQNQSGTASRLSETDSEGFAGEQFYSVRFPRSFTQRLGPQSQIEWGTDVEGQPIRWFVFGEASKHNGSPVTRRLTYKIKRS